MEEPNTLKDTLAESMDAKNFSAEKLAESTGVPERFIHSLTEGDFKNLPAAPYVRGYIAKIAKQLEVGSDEMWRMYERESNPKRSGVADRLPGNRFAIKTVDKKIILASIAGLAIIIYTIANFNRLVGTPKLTVDFPQNATETVREREFVIRGTLGNTKDTLTLNGEPVMADADGTFKKEVELEAGVNTYELVAKRFLGGESKEIRRIIYEAPIFNEPEPLPSENLLHKGQL